MKVGNLVKWIGYPGGTVAPERAIGMIISVYVLGRYNSGDQRVDVMWGKGSIGKALYPQTVEAISENR